MEFYNFALGGTNSIQNLYEVIRHKEIFENAELIISETSINEMQHHFHPYQKLPYSLMYRNLMWLHKELYFLNKKVLILVLPYPYEEYQVIDNIYTKICKDFGFNLINVQKYYNKYSLIEFGKRIDAHHQQACIMKELGKNIIRNIDEFIEPKELNVKNDNPKFEICIPKDMELISGNLQENFMKNSMFNEKTYRLDQNVKLKFPSKLKGYHIVGIHNWNNKDSNTPSFYSSVLIKNEKESISKEFRLTNLFLEVQNTKFQIDTQTQVVLNLNDANFSEFHVEVQTWNTNWARLNFSDLIAFFLASSNGNYYNDAIDFEALANENIEISKIYDFNHLIPPIEIYKEIIDEYCARMDPRKLAPWKKQIDDLINEKKLLQNEKAKLQDELNSLSIKKANLELLNLEQDLINKKLESKKIAKEIGMKLDILMPKITLININSAKARIQNQLCYKLGQVMIRNSKSFLGLIKMPYILIAIVIVYKDQKSNLKLSNDRLPPLETYSDYQEALKEKECFTYKLGEALIKAHKNWYKGGYLKFYLKDVPRLKREFNMK
ncbi:alpha-2,3-sialyltransferase [Campylobacter coli]|nr:alpha-2,3-sialyltransferase [Campylobacter coli]